MTRDAAKALRAGDAEALALLADTLDAGATLAEVARAFGFAGASTLWRIAYASPTVRTTIKKHARKRGQRKWTVSKAR